MYLNAENLPDGTVLQNVDVCIVGAGAAGIPMARRLIGSGKKVLLLVSGQSADRGLPTPRLQSIYRGTAGEFLKKVDPIFLDRSRLHMYGGTTNHFGFWSRPLDDEDLKPRAGYRSAHWPVDRAELMPFYAEANHYGHFGPCNYDDIPFWERALFARCFPPAPDDALRPAIMHAQYAEELHDFQVQFGEELRLASNITVLFNANLLNIESDDRQAHVRALHCSTIEDGAAGRRFRIEAGNYVLAMGGIESIRALKLSGDLGNNKRDHLGRGFMVHPLITHAARLRFARPVDLLHCNFFHDQQVRLMRPTNPQDSYVPASAPRVDPQKAENELIFDAWGVLTPTPAAQDAEKIGNFRVILAFGLNTDEAILNLNWEQIPNEDSRITLDMEHSDPVFGQPVAHLDWRLLEEDKRTAIAAMKLSEAYLRRHGLVDFQLTTDLSGGPDDWTFIPNVGALATGDHHMGAARMSQRPEDGIVNPDSRLHTVDNLYVTGTAVFPTGGFANPTLTVVALALRLADHLKTV
ncbi:MAG: GMC oxidoreductase [Anaerolineae bacterium]